MTVRSLTGKRWIVQGDLRQQLHGDAAALAKLLRETRKLDGPSPLQAYPDMPFAVARVQRAIRAQECVGVFGDYDCDGITGVTQIVRALKRRGCEPHVRLPSRLSEGYGLRRSTVQEFVDAQTTLLLTVDTGISSAAEIVFAASRGIDVIVLDHHRVPSLLPPAYAILHPAIAGHEGPHPSAAGVAYQFIHALEHADGTADWDEDTDLALAALGTVADLVELRGWNREIVQRGLRALSTMREGPLAALLAQAGLRGEPTSRDIAFRLAPRINAAGRMADPGIALRALLGDSAALLALEALNAERQQQTKTLTADAFALAVHEQGPFLALAQESYPPGLLGLIAGKLTESLGKPSLVACVQGDLCTASLRSIPGFHVTEALDACADLLLTYGGHAQAAGCTFKTEHFPALRDRLIAHAASLLTPENLIPTLLIESTLSPEHLTPSLLRALRTLEPFGQGNPEPRFLLEGVQLTASRVVGKDGSHLQARLGEAKVVGFGLGAHLPSVQGPMDLVCRIGMDEWRGNTSLQLQIDDLRSSVQTGAKLPSISKTSVSSAPSARAIL